MISTSNTQILEASASIFIQHWYAVVGDFITQTLDLTLTHLMELSEFVECWKFFSNFDKMITRFFLFLAAVDDGDHVKYEK